MLVAPLVAQTSTRPSPPVRLALPCLERDSGYIAFGRIRTSPEDGDESGVQFVFSQSTDTLRAWIREAKGEAGPERPVDSLAVLGGDSVLVIWRPSNTTYTYRFHLTCRRMSGTAVLFQTPTYPGQLVTLLERRAPRYRRR